MSEVDELARVELAELRRQMADLAEICLLQSARIDELEDKVDGMERDADQALACELTR